MKLSNFGFSSYVGLGIVIFVALVGALGYTYVLKYKAEVAFIPTTSSTKTIAAETMKAPEVKASSDLGTASETLDDVSVDELSDSDLASLEAELSSL